MADPADAAIVYETDIPGLYDVEMPDGTWLRDRTVGQLRSIVFQGTPIRPPVLRDA
jgi:hypothetical protein